jgi:hypothetical protein
LVSLDRVFKLKVGADEFDACYIPQVKMLYLIGATFPAALVSQIAAGAFNVRESLEAEFALFDYSVRFLAAAIGKTGHEWAHGYMADDIITAFQTLLEAYRVRGFFGPVAAARQAATPPPTPSATTGGSSTSAGQLSAGAGNTPTS